MPSLPSALLCPHVPTDSLPGLQGDDNEDGPPVHAPHTAAVAHEVVQDGGEFRPHLQAGEAGRAAGSACRLQPMEGHSWARRHPGSTCPALGRRGTVVWGRRFLLCGPLPSTLHPPSIHSWGTLSATHHAGLGRPTGCGLLAPTTSPTRLGVKSWDWVWAHAQVSVGTAGFCMPWAPLGRGALPWGREEPNLAHVHVSGACGALTHEPRTPAPWESWDHRMNSCHVLPGSGYK